jgi:hypothetical protein
MRLARLLRLSALATAFLVAPTAGADEPATSAAPGAKEAGEEEDDESPARHLEAKAASIVAVKFVAKVMERELSINETGTVVDASGLVMLPNRVKNDRVKFTVSNLRVVFPGDDKEYDAIVAATDSRLDLAFIRIRDLAGKTLVPVDLTESPEAEPGTELFTVTRLDQGFDYAPYFGAAQVVGRITKPRALGILSGFAPGAHVLFDEDGKAAGVVVPQSGVTDGDDRRTRRSFLLPMKAAVATIRQAAKAAETALAADATKPAPAGGETGAESPEKSGEGAPAPSTPPSTPGDGAK